jgi:methyl-accepting chemotaxis protein
MKNSKFNLRMLLLLFAFIPVVVYTVVSSFYAKAKVSELVTTETESVLSSNAWFVYNEIVDMGNNLGDLNIENMQELLDSINENNDVDVTVFSGDTRYLTTIKDGKGKRITGTVCSDDVKQEVILNGNTYFIKNIIINETKYFGYYMPLVNETGRYGMVFVGKPMTEFSTNTMTVVWAIAGVGLFLEAFVLVGSYIMGAIMQRHLKVMMGDLQRVCDGDLSTECNPTGILYEFRAISNSIETFRSTLAGVVQRLKTVADGVSGISVNVDEAVNACVVDTNNCKSAMSDLSTSAMSMAESVQQAAGEVTVIAEATTDINRTSGSTMSVTDNVVYVSEKAKEKLSELISKNSVNVDNVNKIAVTVNKVNELMDNINSAVEFIVNIAEQTNLLSLNASIEAARAGEAGKGFSVVASEIKSLAEESSKSAGSIQGLINDITGQTKKCVSQINSVIETSGSLNETLEEVNTSFESVDKAIANAKDYVADISVKAKSLDESNSKVVVEIETLSSISEENAAASETMVNVVSELEDRLSDINNSANVMRDDVQELLDCIRFFKI